MFSECVVKTVKPSHIIPNNILKVIEDLENELELQRHFKNNKELIYSRRISKRVYHYRDINNSPRITVCVIFDPKDSLYHRGISICSRVDIVNKETGKDISEDRAIAALVNKYSSEEINRMEVNDIILAITNSDAKNFETFYQYKSAYNVTLTDFEVKLFTPKNKK